MSDEFSFEDFDTEYFIPMGWYLKDMEIMEFTNLKDRNHKEIFHSDIVKYEDGVIGIVGIFPGIWVAKLCGKKGSDFNFYETSEEVEVIGNIYENPELLK